MLTIHTKTGRVEGKEHHPKVMRYAFGELHDQTPGYVRGWLPPRFPVPALAYSVEWQPFYGEVVLWNECQRPDQSFECCCVWS